MNGRIFAVTLGLLAVVTGCSGSASFSVGGIDTAKVESALKSGLKEKTNTTLKSVDCPSSVKTKAGATFTCDAKDTDGNSITIVVTQKDAKGNITWEARTFSDAQLAQIADTIKSGITEQTGQATSAVECPPLVFIGQGNVFTCKATAEGGATGDVKVTQKDAAGNVTWKLNG